MSEWYTPPPPKWPFNEENHDAPLELGGHHCYNYIINELGVLTDVHILSDTTILKNIHVSDGFRPPRLTRPILFCWGAWIRRHTSVLPCFGAEFFPFQEGFSLWRFCWLFLFFVGIDVYRILIVRLWRGQPGQLFPRSAHNSAVSTQRWHSQAPCVPQKPTALGLGLKKGGCQGPTHLANTSIWTKIILIHPIYEHLEIQCV